MALASLAARAAQGHALIQGGIFPGFRGFTDDHSHAVINEEAGAEFRARMNFNAREKPGQLGKKARQNRDFQPVKQMVNTVNENRVKTRIQKDDFDKSERSASGRVPLKAGLVITVNVMEKFHGAAAPLLIFSIGQSLFHTSVFCQRQEISRECKSVATGSLAS